MHPRGRFVARCGLISASALASAAAGGCPGGLSQCETPGVICTVAGTGQSLFDGDGKPATETSFYHPLDVEFDVEGRPLILDFNNLRVRRINADNTIQTYMGMDFEAAPIEGAPASETPLHHASDIEYDAEGRLYVAGDHVSVVFRVNLDDRVQTVAGNSEFGYTGDDGPALEASMTAPFGVLPDADGGFYVSDNGVHVIRYVDAAGIITTVAGNGAPGYSGDGGPATEAQLHGPTRMAFDGEGRLHICDTDNHCIRRLEADGAISTVAGDGTLGYSGDGGPADAAQLNSPFDIKFDPTGEGLYIADSGNHVVRRVGADGIIATVVGMGVAGFAGDGADSSACELDHPSGLKFAADGSLWIADTFNHRVRRVAGFLAQFGG